MKQLMLLLAFAVTLAMLADCKGGSGTSNRYQVTVDGEGFHPNHLTVAADKPATIVVTRTTDQTCAKEMVIPTLNMRKELPLNQPVEFMMTPSEKGQIRFACGMDMMTGIIEVQ